jgi:hypothetical protein
MPEKAKLIARLIYERVARYDLNDSINAYVHTFPAEIRSPLVWDEFELAYLLQIYPIELENQRQEFMGGYVELARALA